MALAGFYAKTIVSPLIIIENNTDNFDELLREYRRSWRFGEV